MLVISYYWKTGNTFLCPIFQGFFVFVFLHFKVFPYYESFLLGVPKMFISKHKWSSILQVNSQAKWENEIGDSETRMTK